VSAPEYDIKTTKGGPSMLETVLTAGTDPTWLPTAEAQTTGTGTLCSHDVQNGIYQGNHKYLPFAPNGINWVAQQGQDVISYPFSGCIMAVFEYGGARRVCHVSTGQGQNCTTEWERIKGLSVNVFEFKPAEFVDITALNKEWGYGGCYGLITSDLRTYTITIGRRNDGTDGRSVRKVTTARLLRP
jgi:hypothetical protein